MLQVLARALSMFVLVLHIVQPYTHAHTAVCIILYSNYNYLIVLCTITNETSANANTKIRIKIAMTHVCTRKHNTRALQQTDIGIRYTLCFALPNYCYQYVHKFSLKVISQSLNHLSYVELDFVVALFVHSFEHDHHPILQR